MSSTASGAYVNGAGSSLSKASNLQGAASYTGGSGSYSAKPGNAYVTIDDCEQVKVSGVQALGSATNFGGTSAWGSGTASNVSTGAGTGGAQAVGFSLAEVAGSTTVKAPNMTLNAGGSAFSAVGTNTGVVGVNGSGASSGSTGSQYAANANGSLFTYNSGGITGDIKTVSSNTYTNVGGIPTASSGTCGGGKCVTGPSVANNATVEGGANANAGGEITYTFSK